jgi:hypothetical protein
MLFYVLVFSNEAYDAFVIFGKGVHPVLFIHYGCILFKGVSANDSWNAFAVIFDKNCHYAKQKHFQPFVTFFGRRGLHCD